MPYHSDGTFHCQESRRQLEGRVANSLQAILFEDVLAQVCRLSKHQGKMMLLVGLDYFAGIDQMPEEFITNVQNSIKPHTCSNSMSGPFSSVASAVANSAPFSGSMRRMLCKRKP
jgi:hypothetical protein